MSFRTTLTSDRSLKLPKGRPKDAYAYWSAATDPGHRHSEPWWTEFYANELMLYFPRNSDRVLEFGCGSGTFYPHFKNRCGTYVGVDFSESMLAEFRSTWPASELICADAADLEPGKGALRIGSFDFIFSNQLCQFFDDNKLDRHLEIIRSLMKPDGYCLVANIPDAQLRLHYYAGALRSDRPGAWMRGLKKVLATAAGRSDGIGHWFSRRGIAQVAGKYNFAYETFSSASLEYRFHLLLRRQ
jgi:SAM-dependent methyltransferase